MKYATIILLALSIVSTSCSKKTSTGTSGVAPTNLTVSAVVSTDSSGNVTFTASATDAVSYNYNFGNYNSQNGAGGSIVYKYAFPGDYSVTVTAVGAGGQTITKSINVTVAVALSLVWSDDFNTPGVPDPTKWGFDTGGGGWGNNELENYTSRPANVFVSNGNLTILAQKESYNGSAYTSARMLSNNLYSFEYGRIDVRAKLPASAGTWPAIWMLGDDLATVGWPACGEIDIMEQSGTNKSTIYGTLHYPTEVGQYGDGSTTTNNSASTAFHIYTATWSPTFIQLAVDGTAYYTLSNNQSIPFNHKFFIILNVAMGGNFGGTVDPAFTSDSLVVDYVHVYQ